MMFLVIGAMLVGTGVSAPAAQDDIKDNEVPTYNFPFAPRAEWSAREPKSHLPLGNPVPYVVIHHSYTPKACYTAKTCQEAMRSMQDFHMDDRGWVDVGYNFGVGSDGTAYEGRGWTTLGAHSLSFNNVSIGICLIGDWTRAFRPFARVVVPGIKNSVPPQQQLKTAQALIDAGVALGYVKANYGLVGHRQVRDTECPGDALYKEITTWPHYDPHPPRPVIKKPE